MEKIRDLKRDIFLQTQKSQYAGTFYDPFVLDPTNTIENSNIYIHPGIFNLCEAVLKRALIDFSKKTNRPAEKILKRTARDWFLDKGERHPYSFINICYNLNLDPDYMKATIFKIFGVYGNKKGPKVSRVATAVRENGILGLLSDEDEPGIL